MYAAILLLSPPPSENPTTVGTYFMYVRNYRTCPRCFAISPSALPSVCRDLLYVCPQQRDLPTVHIAIIILFILSIQRAARCSLSVRMACNPSALLFIKHAVRFFSATQWRIFIEIGRHEVRSGLSSWMRKTCFQAAMSASMAIGCNPQTNRFLFSFLYEALSLLRMFIKIPFKGLRPWIHPVF